MVTIARQGRSELAARRIQRRGAEAGSDKMRGGYMLCAAIDIGSNTTRVLVAEPDEGQLRKVMEQRAYTQIGKDAKKDGTISEQKTTEVAEVVSTQVRLADELGAESIRIVATAAIREAVNGEQVAEEIARVAGLPVEVLSDQEEGRLAFIGATKTLGHPVEGEIGVVDVGGGSCEVILGSIADGVREVHSFKIGSGMLADEFLKSDPPGPAEVRALRDRISDFFEDVTIPPPRSGRRCRRERHLSPQAGRRSARVRDSRARDPRTHR